MRHDSCGNWLSTAPPSAAPPALAALWPQNGAAGLDDQGLLLAYWMHRPQAVRVDSGGVLFGHLARWYLLRSEIGLDGRTPLGRAAVPSCVGLHSARKRFADGEGHHCDDAFNADGFSKRRLIGMPRAPTAPLLSLIHITEPKTPY